MLPESDATSVSGLLQWGREELKVLGTSESSLNAEQLLGHVLGLDRVQLHLNVKHVVSQSQLERYQELVQVRKSRKPLAHLLGKQAFWNEELEVGPGCLIPRPETEILVEKIIERGLFQKQPTLSFLDLGCGSGAIGVALLRQFSQARMTFVDISEEALLYTQKNLERYQLLERAELICSDLFEFVGRNKRDLIVSNPPYIATHELETLEPEVLADPHQALDGGIDGMSFYREIVPAAKDYLKPEGVLCFEVGIGQAEEVTKIFSYYGYINVQVYPDLSGIDRVVMAQAEEVHG